MDLSKLLAVPTFITKLPSTGEEIKFRPYLAKEQKLLLIAQASGEESEVFRAVSDIIKVCTFDKVSPDELASFDFEYLWLQIHAKSDGEKVVMSFNGIPDSPCKKCQKPIRAEVDLTQVKIHGLEDRNNIIKLNDDVAIQLKYPKVRESIKLVKLAETSEEKQIIENMFNLIAISIDKIIAGDEVIDAKSLPSAELLGFIENLSSKHYDLIVEKLNNSPHLRHVIDLSCSECGRQQEHVLEGLYSFFV